MPGHATDAARFDDPAAFVGTLGAAYPLNLAHAPLEVGAEVCTIPQLVGHSAVCSNLFRSEFHPQWHFTKLSSHLWFPTFND